VDIIFPFAGCLINKWDYNFLLINWHSDVMGAEIEFKSCWWRGFGDYITSLNKTFMDYIVLPKIAYCSTVQSRIEYLR
jgi:hypothetical protein